MPSLRSRLVEASDDGPQDEDGIHLWSGLLKEVTDKVSIKLPSTRALVVLGDDESGKTTLITRLQDTEDPRKGFGLEYTFIDVKDEDRDDQTKLNVWILDGDFIHSHLLKFALSAENFSDCMIVLVVSMAEPWSIMRCLEKWANLLTDHVKRLPLDVDLLHEYKEGLLRQFRDYIEPDTMLTAPGTPAQVSHAPLPTATLNTHRPSAHGLHKQGLHPATAALLSSSLSGAVKQPEANRAREGSIKEPDCEASAVPSSITELPLDPSTLSNNLGLPVVVVVTKTDSMNSLEKNEQFTEEHFDFIQMHVRRFCLTYGAALFYVSVKEDKNCDLLNRYLRSRMYGFPFTQSAYVVERDCVFVPAGWDSEKKISILEENFTHIRPKDAYNDVIQRPEVTKKLPTREPDVTTPDEQSFLTRLIAMAQREASTPNLSGMPATTNGSAGQSPDSLLEQFAKSATSGTRSPSVVSSPRMSVQPVRGKPSPVAALASGGTTPGSSVTGGRAVGAAGSGSSDTLLSEFFTSLLTKRSSTSPGQAGMPGGTPSYAGLSPGQPPAASAMDKLAMSPKDIQSELERLARGKQELMDNKDQQPSAGSTETPSPEKTQDGQN